MALSPIGDRMSRMADAVGVLRSQAEHEMFIAEALEYELVGQESDLSTPVLEMLVEAEEAVKNPSTLYSRHRSA